MNVLQKLRYNRFSQNPQAEIILKEAFRKAIHILSAFVPMLAKYFFINTIITLSLITIFYIIFELFRIKGKKIFFFTTVTKFASRKRDSGKFVLGPVTLALGVIFTLCLFPLKPASIGIFALAFGDGLSSLSGKCFGKRPLKIVKYKTVEGSLTCFVAVFISSFFITKNIWDSLLIAITATFVEALPLKDFDNIIIPLIIATFGQFLI